MTEDDQIEPVPLIFIDLEPQGIEVPYSGRVEVTTESGSLWLLDLEAEFVCRIRGTEQPDDPAVRLASHLRRDGDQIRLLRIVALEVGRPAIFDVAGLRPEATFTRRTTTYVTRIRQLDVSERQTGGE